jgi:hypothetical protein
MAFQDISIIYIVFSIDPLPAINVLGNVHTV